MSGQERPLTLREAVVLQMAVGTTDGTVGGELADKAVGALLGLKTDVFPPVVGDFSCTFRIHHMRFVGYVLLDQATLTTTFIYKRES